MALLSGDAQSSKNEQMAYTMKPDAMFVETLIRKSLKLI
jgi:hypothetical protein